MDGRTISLPAVACLLTLVKNKCVHVAEVTCAFQCHATKRTDKFIQHYSEVWCVKYRLPRIHSPPCRFACSERMQRTPTPRRGADGSPHGPDLQGSCVLRRGKLCFRAPEKAHAVDGRNPLRHHLKKPKKYEHSPLNTNKKTMVCHGVLGWCRILAIHNRDVVWAVVLCVLAFERHPWEPRNKLFVCSVGWGAHFRVSLDHFWAKHPRFNPSG